MCIFVAVVLCVNGRGNVCKCNSVLHEHDETSSLAISGVAVTNCGANCVVTSRPKQWGPFFWGSRPCGPAR